MANIVKHGKNTIVAHLKHLQDHDQAAYFKEAVAYLKENGIEDPGAAHLHAGHGHSGCPGARVIDMQSERKSQGSGEVTHKAVSELRTWPVQIMLAPISAPYFNGADLLIAADCVPFAYPDFHSHLLRGKILLIGCPKLDDLSVYKEKIKAIISGNDIKSVTYAHMEVPCCFGLISIIEEAIKHSDKKIPFEDVTITIRGQRR